MHWMSSINSIEEEHGYFNGASNQDSTIRWSPKSSQLMMGRLSEQRSIKKYQPSFHRSLPLHLETVGIKEGDQQEELIRLLCHWLIDFVPKDGLPELIEQLLQIIEFHNLQTQTPKLSLNSEPIKAKLTHQVTRPTFSIEHQEE